MLHGSIQEILICENSGDNLQYVDEANLIQGRGIEGDRYFNKTGTFSKDLEGGGDFEVTLIESEEIDSFNKKTGLDYQSTLFRRNIVTQNIRLNELVGKQFSIGDTVLFGARLCEPCAYLSGLLGDEIMQHMVHKSGLRAIIQQGGIIQTGATIASI